MNLLSDLYVSRKALAGFVTIGGAWAIYFAQMPVIKQNIGASDGVYGAVMLVASFGAIAAMWLAPLAQRYLGQWGMPFAAVGVGAGMLVAASATDLVWFGVGMFLASAGSGILDVLVNVRIATVEEATGRKLMNLNHGMYSFAYAAGALVTGGLREIGLTPATVFSGVFLLCLWLAWACRGHDPVPSAEDVAKAPVPGRFILLAGVVVLIAFLTEAATEGWSALHLERTLSGGAAEGALGPALLGLTMGIGRLSGHFLARSVGDGLVMMLAGLVCVFGVVLAGAAGSLATAYVGFALAGLGVSVMVPLAMAQVVRVVPRAARVFVISRVSAIGYGAYFVGPPLMGFVSEGFGLRVSFYMIAVCLAVATIALVPRLVRTAPMQALDQ